MGKLSGAEKKVVPVGSNWREARHTFGTEEFVRVRINFISNRTNTCPMLLFRNKRDGEKCRYGGIGRRTGFRIPRLVRESSSLSTCKYLYNFSRSISQKTLFLIFQLDLLSILIGAQGLPHSRPEGFISYRPFGTTINPDE